MKIAALDLGTNTSLLLVCEVKNHQVVRVFADESRVTRLGQEVEAHRRLHPEALERAEKCFSDYQKIIDQHQCDKVIAVATSAARDAKNFEEFVRIGEKYSIPIHIISGQLEAKLTFLGATSHLPSSEGVAVIDVGGGSTEIITETLTGQWEGQSLDIGSVRITEKFGLTHPLSKVTYQRITEFVRQVLKTNEQALPKKVLRVVAVAATPTTLSCLLQNKTFSEAEIEGYKISIEQIDQIRDQLSAMTLSEIKGLKGMDPQRADVIFAGSTILSESIKFLNRAELQVSVRGVRYGLAMCWQEILSKP